MARLACLLILALLLVQGLAPSAQAREAWLVTYGPGQEVWERFGHNAIWLRDAGLGLDHVYSFGYFDMDRSGFYLDFARGIMNYYGAVARAESEFAFYRRRDRSIRTQKLDLDAAQFRQLHALLQENIFPIPRYYDYDYFFANCSTWLRDLIDQVADGQVRAQLARQPARLDFRDHIRRYNEDRLALRAGLMLLLGPMIDRPRSAWEEGFVPDGLARTLATVRVDGAPLLGPSRTLYESRRHRAPAVPAFHWQAYGGAGVLMALLVALARWRPSLKWTRLPWQLAALACGLAGVLVLLMWFATAHQSVAGNRIVLLLNPLWLLLLLPLPRAAGRVLWWLLAAAAATGAVLLAWPGGLQHRPEMVVGLAPLVMAMLWVSWPPASAAYRVTRRP